MFKPRVLLAIIAIIGILNLQGCSDEWAFGFARGTPVPDARLNVELAEPIPNRELLDRLNEAFRLGGFPARDGLDPSFFDQELRIGKHYGWGWHPTRAASYADSDYHINVFWEESGSDPTNFDFIFYNGRTDGFTGIEWLMFAEWKEERLPAAFPGSVLTVTGHPAESTDFEELLEISEATNMPIPDDVMRRFEEWKTNTE